MFILNDIYFITVILSTVQFLHQDDLKKINTAFKYIIQGYTALCGETGQEPRHSGHKTITLKYYIFS